LILHLLLSFFLLIIKILQDELPVIASLKGMCKTATREISWEDGDKVNLMPLFVKDASMAQSEDEVGVAVRITLSSITTANEYQIFSSLRQGNITDVLELIDQHVGVNACDEWGQTPLMIAVQMNRIDVVAALLNTRKPKVDVNAAKSVRNKLILFFFCIVISFFSVSIQVWLHCIVLRHRKVFPKYYHRSVTTWGRPQCCHLC
jgi:hypothetical protein